MLGVIPTQERVVAERFFDESGGMQLILHAPFGSRVNKAWGLALRKRFCRQFNFELQAAATEEAVLLSLGPQHSFPLETVFQFLHPDTAQRRSWSRRCSMRRSSRRAGAGTRTSRWRCRGRAAAGRCRRRIQRMEADDLLAAAFPDAAACLENIPGDREIPDHPLVRQVIDDCLHEAMDLDRFLVVLARHPLAARSPVSARDLPEPSPLAHEILNAKPYAFLDDAPLEERRAQAVYSRRAFEPGSAEDLGALDQAAIDRVKDEVWPEVVDPDELYDALLVSGFLTEAEGVRGRDGSSWEGFFEVLARDGRAARIAGLWVATERWVLVERLEGSEGREEAIRELLRGRMEIVGPITTAALADSLGVDEQDADTALVALESDGVVLRGRFTPGTTGMEWCDRRLLARIHRYTLNRLRAEIEPVNTADLMRFLLAWQRVEPGERAAGLEGLASVIEQLEGYEAPAGAWESELLGARTEEYDPSLLDMLTLTGRVSWRRLSSPNGSSTDGDGAGNGARPIRTTPVSLFPREDSDLWNALASLRSRDRLSANAKTVLEVLDDRGASFFAELVSGSRLLPTHVEQALAELVSFGLVTSDSYAGLRALLVPSARRKTIPGAPRRQRTVGWDISSAGRWSAVSGERLAVSGELPRQDVEALARVLLKRYGIVFNRLLSRESVTVPWRELLRVYRRLEARGEIRGGRFIAGVTGEQFALPDAVARLRAARRAPRTGQLLAISAVDPLNLLGIVGPGERIAALAGNRIVFEDGVPLAVLEKGQVRPLVDYGPDRSLGVERALARRPVSSALRARLGIPGRTPSDPAGAPRRRWTRGVPQA